MNFVFDSFWHGQQFASVANQKLQTTYDFRVLRFNNLKLLSNNFVLLCLPQQAAQGNSTGGKMPLRIAIPNIYADHPIEHVSCESAMLCLNRCFIALVSNEVTWIEIKLHIHYLLILSCHQALLIWLLARLQIRHRSLLLLEGIKLSREKHPRWHLELLGDLFGCLKSNKLYIDCAPELFICQFNCQSSSFCNS